MNREEYDQRIQEITREAKGASLGIALSLLILLVLYLLGIGDAFDKILAVTGISIMMVSTYFGSTLLFKLARTRYLYEKRREERCSDE